MCVCVCLCLHMPSDSATHVDTITLYMCILFTKTNQNSVTILADAVHTEPRVSSGTS
jgi:hypothetical protein